VTLGDIEWLYK